MENILLKGLKGWNWIDRRERCVEMSVWSDVLIGIAAVAGSVIFVKYIYMWNIYRRSIQTEIYSNFIEYQMRCKNLLKLSESYYLKSRFGKHRIVYQMAQAKNSEIPQAYVIIILTSGLYILCVKNQSGRVIAKRQGDFKQFFIDKKRGKAEEKQFLFKNPLNESRYFEKRLRNLIPNIDCPIMDMVVFPKHCEISWEGKEDETIPVIQRKQMIEVLKNNFEKHEKVLTENDVDYIFHTLADEAIEREKENR